MKQTDNKTRLTNRILSTTNDNIRERERNKKINRFHTMDKVRKFNIYDFKQINDKIVETRKKVDLTKVNIKRLINKVKFKDNYTDYGIPLPITKNSKIIGVFRGHKQMTKKSKKYNKDITLENCISSFDPKRYKDIYDYRIYPGDWSHACNNLKDMATPRDKYYSWEQLLEGYFSRIDKELILPDCQKYNVDSILGLGINPKANSGILTTILVGGKRKSTTRMTKVIAHNYAKKIMCSKEQILDKSLSYVGGREKRVKYDPNNVGVKDLKTRIIIGQEDIPTLIAQSLARHINEALQNIDDGFNYGGRVNGRSNFLKFRDMFKCVKFDEVNVNVDFSGHDNKVMEDAIVAAMGMLRLCFEESEEIDKLFYYVMSSLIFKRIVLPESGFIYEISKGVSTGHGLTSIITTLCSYGTFSTSLLNVCKTKEELDRTWMVMAGDDVMLKLPVHLLDKLQKEIDTNSGHVIDNLHENSGYLDSYNDKMMCTFLKKSYAFGHFCWNSPELYHNLINPTLKGGSFGVITSNLRMMIYQAPMNLKLNNLIKALIICQYIKKACFNVRGIYRKYFKLDRLFDFIDWVKDKLYDYDYDIQLMNYNYGRYEVVNMDLLQYDNTQSLSLFIKNKLNELNNVISQKRSWFTEWRPFKHWEKNTRLLVFDVAKLNTKPANLPFVVETLDLIYGSDDPP